MKTQLKLPKSFSATMFIAFVRKHLDARFKLVVRTRKNDFALFLYDQELRRTLEHTEAEHALHVMQPAPKWAKRFGISIPPTTLKHDRAVF